jgi:bifunctional non-homologous end joining protein LigD
MPFLKRRSAFDDPSWIFELKYDGFRALATIDRGRAKLISRTGHHFGSFDNLERISSKACPVLAGQR